MDGALAEMDATLAKLAAAKPDPSQFNLEGLDAARVARGTDLTMRTLAAMHVAATFRELPAEVQTRHDVQQRMAGALPLLDDAMLDMADYLRSLSPAERRAIQERLRTNPSVAMDGIGKLDEHAATMGIPNRRRLQMRAIATHVSWRMTRQSVDALLGDTLDKVQRVVERHGRDEQLQRALAAKVAEAQLFDAGRAHPVLAYGVPANPRKHRAATVLGVGASLLGTGGILAGIGAYVVTSAAASSSGYGPSGTWMAGAFSITVGALLGLAGIIVLIVGAAMAANEDNDDEYE